MFLATDLRFFLISRGSPDPVLVLCDYLLIGFQDVSKCPLEENQFKTNYITFLINERLFKSKFCTRDGQVLKKKQLFLHSHEICQIISFWNVNSYCQSKGSFLQHREALYFFLPVHPPSVHCPEDAPGRARHLPGAVAVWSRVLNKPKLTLSLLMEKKTETELREER